MRARHVHKAAVALVDVLEREEQVDALAVALAVLPVVGARRVPRLVAAPQRRGRVAGGVAEQLRLEVEAVAQADELIQRRHDLRLHQQLTKGVPLRGGQVEQLRLLGGAIERRVERVDLPGVEQPRHVQHAGDIEGVVGVQVELEALGVVRAAVERVGGLDIDHRLRRLGGDVRRRLRHHLSRRPKHWLHASRTG